jgi:hypothetical protein
VADIHGAHAEGVAARGGVFGHAGVAAVGGAAVPGVVRPPTRTGRRRP